MGLPENFKEQVLNKLSERGVSRTCEICSKNNWTLVDQATSVPITDLSGGVRLPQPHIPCVSLICNNCGNVRLLALGALGIDADKKK